MRPLVHGLVAELAHRIDHERLDFVRSAEGRVRASIGGDPEDRFKLREDLRPPLELVVEFLEPPPRDHFVGC